jgi:Gene product 88
VRTVRPLLLVGNDKLSQSIFQWSIPAIETCPGRTPACAHACYAMRGHFLFDAVQERLEWNQRQALMGNFVDRMVDEVFRKGCIVVRVHVSGDFGTPTYTRKWVEIVSRSPQTTFFAYTRSWRVAKIDPVLRELAALPNMRLWYSADRQTGWPEHIPETVRVAWMQDTDEVGKSASLAGLVRSAGLHDEDRAATPGASQSGAALSRLRLPRLRATMPPSLTNDGSAYVISRP